MPKRMDVIGFTYIRACIVGIRDAISNSPCWTIFLCQPTLKCARYFSLPLHALGLASASFFFSLSHVISESLLIFTRQAIKSRLHDVAWRNFGVILGKCAGSFFRQITKWTLGPAHDMIPWGPLCVSTDCPQRAIRTSVTAKRGFDLLYGRAVRPCMGNELAARHAEGFVDIL